jgi:hypothetical protein
MNRTEFGKMRDAAYAQVVKLNDSKGHDYSGDDDALANFKEQAKDADVTPEKVWMIFFGKHLSAIKTYVREWQVQSEPIEGRILDAILYLFLLLGLVEEKKSLDMGLDVMFHSAKAQS